MSEENTMNPDAPCLETLVIPPGGSLLFRIPRTFTEDELAAMSQTLADWAKKSGVPALIITESVEAWVVVSTEDGS